MIGGVTRHGRTRRDAQNLSAHLLKENGVVVRIANSVAIDPLSAMEDMLLARDGSRASSAFLHVHISPGREMTERELRKAAMVVLKHFNAIDHASVLVIHEKEREGGEGRRHAHLVVGRIGPDGSVLPSGFEKIRLETAMRIVEFELGDKPVLGRHHVSSVRWLRERGRDDVADWLEASHGPSPQKPVSSASPKKRQSLERHGVSMSKARASIQAALATSSGDVQAFRKALSEQGFSIVRGDKPGVWIVRRGDLEIGSLDRIVRMKRKEVSVFMETLPENRKEVRPVRATQKIRPEQLDRMARIDLDELRWRAEAFGRSVSRSLVDAQGRERVRAAIHAEVTRLSAKAPPSCEETRRRDYDVPDGPKFRPKFGRL